MILPKILCSTHCRKEHILATALILHTCIFPLTSCTNFGEYAYHNLTTTRYVAAECPTHAFITQNNIWYALPLNEYQQNEPAFRRHNLIDLIDGTDPSYANLQQPDNSNIPTKTPLFHGTSNNTPHIPTPKTTPYIYVKEETYIHNTHKQELVLRLTRDISTGNYTTTLPAEIQKTAQYKELDPRFLYLPQSSSQIDTIVTFPVILDSTPTQSPSASTTWLYLPLLPLYALDFLTQLPGWLYDIDP